MEKVQLLQKVKNLPKVPGVYLFKNKLGTIIYVGKAKSLRSRVGSYFSTKFLDGTKTKSLVERIVDLEYIEALSELEALILESKLIKKYKPKYNIALKDDKSYLYIVIKNEELTKNGRKIKIPKVMTARETDLKDVKKRGNYIFGPYPHARYATYIVRLIRKALPYRDCSPSKFQKYEKLNSPCLYGHLNLCPAPCTDKITVKEYKSQIRSIKKLLSGESTKMIRQLERKMQKASSEQKYEQAQKFRDTIKKFNYIRQSFKSADKYVENPYLVEDLIAQSLDNLVEAIPSLKSTPSRIECYDISNLSGKEATASMVVAIDGRIKKSEYRKFKIKTKNEPDDFGMMAEALQRRFKREKSTAKNIKKWGTPDLLVMDGGKGQVSAIRKVLQEYQLDIPLIGLAKRLETIVFFDEVEQKFVEVNLPKTNEGLKLLQRLRDEAHRTAKHYHHILRLKKLKEK